MHALAVFVECRVSCRVPTSSVEEASQASPLHLLLLGITGFYGMKVLRMGSSMMMLFLSVARGLPLMSKLAGRRGLPPNLQSLAHSERMLWMQQRRQGTRLRRWSSLLGNAGGGGNVEEKEEVEEEEGDLENDDDEEEAEEGGGQRDPNEGSLRLKVRQHVNPLSSRYQVPVPLDKDWISQTFPHPNQPILIDIGCAKGTWALKYAKAHPHHNILGLEIRRPVVEFALRRKQSWDLANVHFLATNANVDIKRILGDLTCRGTEIVMVTIHHPDPHFKTKHKKRRVVTDEFVEQLVSLLPTGTNLFVQSDVLDCCQDMVTTIANNPHFQTAEGHTTDGIAFNPAPTDIKTEREVATLAKGLPCYRCLFQRV